MSLKVQNELNKDTIKTAMIALNVKGSMDTCIDRGVPGDELNVRVNFRDIRIDKYVVNMILFSKRSAENRV